MQLKKLMIIEGLINSKSCAAKTICVCLFVCLEDLAK
jgi:hypothetical protein